VAFIVNMEAMVDGVALYVRNESGNINHSHTLDTTV
jgi:hypothetical protein